MLFGVNAAKMTREPPHCHLSGSSYQRVNWAPRTQLQKFWISTFQTWDHSQESEALRSPDLKRCSWRLGIQLGQLNNCLAHTKLWVSSPAPYKPIMVDACLLVPAFRGWGQKDQNFVQGHLGLHNEFKASLGYTDHVSKKDSTKPRSSWESVDGLVRR